MALTIIKISETSQSVELGETIWLNADRSEALPEGHLDAAFLLGTAGKRISLAEADRLGLLKGAKTKVIDVTPSTKESEPEADKSAEPEADKDAKPASVKDVVASIAAMSDEELEALGSDERVGVQKALAAELAKRASADE